MPRTAQQRATARAEVIGEPAPGRDARRRAPSKRAVPGRLPERGSQEERLIEALIDLCAEVGYLNVSVAEVSSRAAVSSKTFYEIFQDKEDCLLGAYRAAAARLLADVQPVGEEGDWSGAARAVIERLLVAIQEHPNAARLLLVEALAGGTRLRTERERVLGLFEQRAQQFLDSAPRGGKTLDLPADALIGAVRSLVSRQLRTRGEDRIPLFVDDLLTWLESYAIPAGDRRWSTSSRSLLPASVARQARADRALPTRERLPRGRHRLPAGVVARSHRSRIINGTAEVMMEKGYEAATVSDIVSAAGISREVFYEHFANKQDAYLAAQQHGTQHILESCTAAYFSRDAWPERVWSALETLTAIIAASPALSHLRLVECYAAGPVAIEHTEQLRRSATIFLQEGFHVSRSKSVPPLATHAISGAVFEAISGHVARGEMEQLRRSVPRLTYIAIAPFMGPRRAIGALEKLRERAVSGAPG